MNEIEMRLDKIKRTMQGILFSMVLLVLAQVIGELFKFLPLHPTINSILYGVFSFSIVFIGIKYIGNRILGKNYEDLAITRPYIHYNWLVIGVLLPIIVSITIILISPGKFIINEFSISKFLNILIKDIFILGLISGVTEELIFRGLIMHSIKDTWGKKISIYIPALVFGIIYSINGRNLIEKTIYLFTGATKSVMLSQITYSNESVWPSAYVHALWNIIISGNLIDIGLNHSMESLISYVIKVDSPLVTGGEFGIGYSLIAIIGFVLVAAIAEYKSNDRKV